MQPQLTVAGLLRGRSDTISLPLELLSGEEGTERPITSPHIQKTGLALAGFHEYLQPGRVLVFGESEVRYLDALDSETLLNVLATAFTHDIPCVLITGGWTPPPQLVTACERFHVPLLRTSVATPAAIARIGATSVAAATFDSTVLRSEIGSDFQNRALRSLRSLYRAPMP